MVCNRGLVTMSVGNTMNDTELLHLPLWYTYSPDASMEEETTATATKMLY